MDSGNNHTQLILKIDLRSDTMNELEDSLEECLSNGTIDGYYFLTRNGVPIVHRDEHLAPETRLGYAISTLQSDDILIRSLSDVSSDRDPETGIQYGDLI